MTYTVAAVLACAVAALVVVYVKSHDDTSLEELRHPVTARDVFNAPPKIKQPTRPSVSWEDICIPSSTLITAGLECKR